MREANRLVLVALACLLCWASRQARGDDDAPASILAGRAREVLRQHCWGCHAEHARAGVNLEDPSRSPGRDLVVPNQPDASLLLDLVEGGSMPPGTRPKVPDKQRAILRDWVRAGAPPFPPEARRDYLLYWLLADFGRLPAERKQHTRYISVNHLKDKSEQQAARDSLLLVLRHLRRKDKPAAGLKEIDPGGTLFRLDLTDWGWQDKPFKDESLNLFDLVLLEYPYGVLPALPPAVTAFLRQSKQVRPIPYVRGDWLIHALTSPPLHADFLAALDKPPTGKPPAVTARFRDKIDLDTAQRELESNLEGKRLLKVLGSIKALVPLTRKETVARSVWEQHFGEVVRRLELGVPILPLDGLTAPDQQPIPPFKIELRLIDAKDVELAEPPAKERFIAGKDNVRIWVRTNQDTILELVYTNDRGKKSFTGKKKTTYFIEGGDPVTWAATWAPGLPGAQRRSVTLYAFAKPALGADYPAGRVLRNATMAGRGLHPLYEVTANGKLRPPDPARMVKLTVSFVVVKP